MKTFTQLDICFPDYFQGHGGYVWAVPVDCETTAGQIIESIESDDGWFDSDQDFTEAQFEAAVADLKKQGERFKGRPVFADLEPVEGDETLYSYYCLD